MPERSSTAECRCPKCGGWMRKQFIKNIFWLVCQGCGFAQKAIK